MRRKIRILLHVVELHCFRLSNTGAGGRGKENRIARIIISVVVPVYKASRRGCSRRSFCFWASNHEEMVSRRTAAHSTHDGGRRQEEEEEEEEEDGATAACSHHQQNNNRSTNSYHLPTRPTTSGKQNKPNFFVKKIV
jgi:hypothetical protein